MKATPALLWATLLTAATVFAQPAVRIHVDAAIKTGPLRPAWSFFGYDEPNYTYMQYGRKLLGELSALSPAPVHIRCHNLLTSGDGTPSLKWGSTNAYTEDPSGRPVYDWKILDRIFDTFRETGVKPLVEIGFMPEALSSGPPPYRMQWPEQFSTGWAFPPKDYRKWAELVHGWVRHAVERYGRQEVETWYWELWNEPDISYWRGTPEEYFRLYDFTADAVKRALPTARIGGPHSTGPANPKAAEFLRSFLEHCVRGRNYATGGVGAPLDYIGFHAKGSPAMVGGRVRMGIREQALSVARGFEIIASFPELRGKPVIIGESDPEGCAACSARSHPQNAYRNGPLYACYTAAMFKHTLDLAERYDANLEGAVTWAFEFEGQPYFDGFRTLATNGIDKPVLNVFRMFGLMGPDRLKVESDGAVPLDAVLQAGVRERPDINALASRGEREVSVLVWNYHDDDTLAPDAAVRLAVSGIPASARRVLMRHFRIDERHSNAYTVWKELGSPQSPSPEQYAWLEAAGQLELLESPRWLSSSGGQLEVGFRLPRQAVSLIQFSW
ncbi:MAG: beta-xylosidase [Bryobacteraceae bacterium]